MTGVLMALLPEFMLLGLAICSFCGMFGFARPNESSAFLKIVLVLSVFATVASIWLPIPVPCGYSLLTFDVWSLFFRTLLFLLLSCFFLFAFWVPYLQSYLTHEYVGLLLLSVVGGGIVCLSYNLVILFLGLELQALPLAILIVLNRKNSRHLEAGIKYFLLGGLASSFILFGLSFIYGTFQTVDMATLNGSLREIAAVCSLIQLPGPLTTGIILLFSGIAFKLSLAPMHMWTPDVYDGAETPTTLILATFSKIVALSFLAKAAFSIFKPIMFIFAPFFEVLACLSMIVGAFGGLRQRSLKRLMAYGTINHMGYAFLCVASMAHISGYALTVYLVLYVPVVFFVFLLIFYLSHSEGQTHADVFLGDLSTLSIRNPRCVFLLMLCVFSLAGFPPFPGFFAKFYVMIPLLENQSWLLLSIFVVSSVVSSAYYLRILRAVYFQPISLTRFGNRKAN
jgi:proton-translocating NADH-quinone oxidoreductase chain N